MISGFHMNSKNSRYISGIIVIFLLSLSTWNVNIAISSNSESSQSSPLTYFNGDTFSDESEFSPINDIQAPQFNPASSANYDSGLDYEWWSTDWTYRFPIEVNSSFYNRTNYSINLYLNFTSILSDLSLSSEEFDENSIRVIQYDASGSMIVANSSYSDSKQYLLKSLFIPTENVFNALNNATGRLWIEIPGMMEANTNVTLMVYFDIVSNGPKDSLDSALTWKTNYNWYSDPVSDGNYHLAYGSYRKSADIGYGELTIWDEDLSLTMGEPRQYDYLQNFFDMAAGDFDGDGNVELVMNDINDDFKFVDYNSETGQWQSIWNTRYYFEGLNTTYGSTHYDIYAWDMDHDGKTEIIAPDYGYDANSKYSIVIYGIYSNKTMYIENRLILPYRIMHASLVDLNNDGWMDIVVGNYAGNYGFGYFLYNTTTSSYDWYGYTSNNTDRHIPRYVYSIIAEDIDFDGKIEVLLGGNYYGYIHLWEWNGTALDWKANFITNTPNGIVSDVADWDNDGNMEVLMGNSENTNSTTIRVYEVEGDNSINLGQIEWYKEDVLYSRITFPRFGDPDNDGMMEIIANCYSGPDTSTYYDGRISVWEQSDMTNPEWQSPEEGYYIGNYYVYSSQMTNIFGAYDSRILAAAPEISTYSSQIKPPDLTIQVYDVDKYPISNLGVILDNKNGPGDYSEILISSSDGTAQFADLDFSTYNLNVSIQNQFGNHSIFSGTVTINNTRETFIIDSDLWQIHFKVHDVDNNPVSLGNLTLYEGTWGDTSNLAEYNLDGSGEATAIWLNRNPGNEYNFSIDYQNTNYNPSITPILNSSLDQQALTEATHDLNASVPTDLTGGDYEYQWFIYANGTTGTSINQIGDQSINWWNISLSNISSYISRVDVYGLDNQGGFNLLKTYTEDFTGNNVKDWSEEYYLWNYVKPIYGLNIKIRTHNDSNIVQYGQIYMELQETYVKDVEIPIAQQKITVVDPDGVNIEGAMVEIVQNGVSLVNLTSDELGVAQDSFGFNFWYKLKDGSPSQGNYTAYVYYGGSQKTFKNASDTGSFVDSYNFTLAGYNEVTFNVSIYPDDYQTYLTNITAIPTNFDFSSTLSFDINVSVSYKTNPATLFNADSVGVRLENVETLQEVYYNASVTRISTGIYRIQINPEKDGISVDEASNVFQLSVWASTTGYGGDPTPLVKTITINPIATTAAVYTESSLIGSTLEVYYGTQVSVTLVYQANSADVGSATATIDWDYDSNQAMSEVSGGGYTNYTFSINTSKVASLGQYQINFDVSHVNYSSQTLSFDLIIKEINTSINSADYIDPIELYWEENFTFTINYTDVVNNYAISGADVYYYIFGDPTFTPHPLTETATPGIYSITLNSTDFGQAGEYNFQILAEKEFYKTSQVWITVDISIVPTEFTTPESNIAITWGESFTISTTFMDIRGAAVAITDGNVSVDFTGPNGYENHTQLSHTGNGDYNITYSAENHTFPEAGTYTFVVTATKNQYETQVLTISVDIAIVQTSLTPDATTIDIYWGELFTLGVTYEDVSDSQNPIPISTDASVSYSVSGMDSLVGTLDFQSNGYYSKDFSSTMFGTTGSYTIQIEASKSEYETQRISIIVNVKQITTRLTPESTLISVAWENDYILNCTFEDTHGASTVPITDGTITYTVIGPNGYTSSGFLTHLSDGVYLKSFNPSEDLPEKGTYVYNIIAQKNHYLTRNLTITVEVATIPTSLTAVDESIVVQLGNSFTLALLYQNNETGTPIPITSDATVSYEVTGPNGFSDTGVISHTGSGWYNITLNADDFGQGTFTFLVTATKNQYETKQLSIIVDIGLIPTQLNASNEEITLYWTQNIILQVQYMNVTNLNNPVAINNASVTYTLTDDSSFTGNLIGQGSGIYLIEFSSTLLEQTGTYTFIISASKSTYGAREVLITVNVLTVTTNMTSDYSVDYSLTWNENFTISILYEDLVNDIPITNALITYSVGQIADFTGDLIHTGSGHYEITFNSTQFLGVGTYTIHIQAAKSQYTTQTLSIYVDINRIETTINNSIFLQNTLKINVTTEHLFMITYEDAIGNGIENADLAYYEWEVSGETQIGQLQELGNGIYLLDFDTANRSIGTYLLIIHMGKANYLERAGSITIQIEPKPVKLAVPSELQDNVVSQPQGEDIIIQLTLTDPVNNNQPLTNATVTMNYRGKTYSFEEKQPGVYEYIIKTDTDEYNALISAITDSATIYIQKANYSINPYTITISITPPEYVIAGTHIPKIFVYIGGSVALIAIAIVGSTKYIRYLRIPETIKKIDQTMKEISKNATISDDPIMRSYHELLADKYGNAWKFLDLDLEDILDLKGPKAVKMESKIGSEDQKQGGGF